MARKHMMEELLARSGVYRFLSAAFAFPDQSAWNFLWGDDGRRALKILTGCGSGLETPLKAFSSSGRERFVEEHVAVFGLTAGGLLPPYESPYGAGNLFQEADCMADIAGFYRAFGLESADSSPERPDHIAVEFEFMHFLAAKEAYALSNQWAERARVCRDAQKLFVKEHLGRWAPFFLSRLAELAKGRIFEPIANAAAAWIAADCQYLEVAIKPGELKIARFDSPPVGADFSCGVDSCEAADSCGANGFGPQLTTMPNAPIDERNKCG